MPTLPAQSEWLRANVSGSPIEVDLANSIIRGYVLAEAGPFKSEGRGEFDRASLERIVELANAKPAGLKSRFGHPTLSDDGLGKFLGRAKAARLDDKGAKLKVRGDLHLDPTSFSTPAGNLGQYVLDLAKSDSDAFSSSLVLMTAKEYRLEKDGKRTQDKNGKDLPPLWRPKALHASDVVDTGDAVDGFLSIDLAGDELPDAAVRRASEILDQLFAGCPREVTAARLAGFAQKYLELRYGPAPTPAAAVRRLANAFRSLQLRGSPKNPKAA